MEIRHFGNNSSNYKQTHTIRSDYLKSKMLSIKHENTFLKVVAMYYIRKNQETQPLKHKMDFILVGYGLLRDNYYTTYLYHA